MNYLDMTGYHGQEVKIKPAAICVVADSAFQAKLEGDLAVIGKITHLEVVSRVKFEGRRVPRRTISEPISMRLYSAESKD